MEKTKMRDLREVMRDEMAMRQRIVQVLEGGALTIPEIADRLGFPSREVMIWVMGMRRYGSLVERGRPNEDGYFQYEIIESEREK